MCAQLGVPAAVVKLGLADGVLKAGEGAAVISAALVSLGLCGAGAAIASRAIAKAEPGTPTGTPPLDPARA